MNLALKHSATAFRLQPPTLEKGGVVTPPPVPTIRQEAGTVLESGTFSEAVTIDDAEFDRNTGATYYDNGAIVVEHLPGVEFVSLNPEVATIAPDGVITKVSDGLCQINAVGEVTLSITIDLTSTIGGITDYYTGPVSGCIAEHFSDQVDSRIDNTMTMAANGKIFSTQDHGTPNYVRNANLWCGDIDLTCISPWNSRNSNRRAGTLVTPRHVLNAAHYPLYNGDVIRFIEADGTVHTRTIVGAVNHPDYSPYYPDLRLYTLDSDLPVAISPCEVCPADWNDYAVQNYHNRPAVLGLDQEEKALVIDWNGGGSHLTPTDADRLIFHESKIGGDSGNPAFLILNGALVLTTVWTGGGAGSGTPVADFITDLNAMIVTADAQAGIGATGYTVTEANFVKFPFYGNYLNFSGTSQAVDYGVDQVDVDGKSFVASCRVKFDDLASSPWRLWNNRGTGGFGTQAGFQFSSSDGSKLGNTALDDGVSQQVGLTGVSHGLVAGTWYDVAMVFDTTTGRLSFWRDWVEIGASTNASMIGVDLTSMREWRFGAASNDIGGHEFDGQARDAKVFTSDAGFSAADMAEIAAGRTPDGATLHIDTPFNDGEGTQCDDQSGLGNHGTFNGSPTWN